MHQTLLPSTMAALDKSVGSEGASVGFEGCRHRKVTIPCGICGLDENGLFPSHFNDTCGLIPDLWARVSPKARWRH